MFQRIFWAFLLGATALAVAEPHLYHCGDFLNNTLPDDATTLLYGLTNRFIRLFSRHFSHEQLFPGDELSLEAIRSSLRDKPNKWAEYEEWWIGMAAALVIGSALFTLLYILYRCCLCCCCGEKGEDKPLSTDGRFDGCRRGFLNSFCAVLVLCNILVVVALLLSSQYAAHGIEQLPDRLNNCVGDLAIYKTNTKRQIDKLLADDFHENSESLLKALKQTGTDVVQRFKNSISADIFDELIDREEKSTRLQKTALPRAHQLIDECRSIHSAVGNSIAKLKTEFHEAANDCDPQMAPICLIADRAVSTLETKSGVLESLRYPEQMEAAAEKLSKLQFAEKLRPVETMFADLEERIQRIVDDRLPEAQSRLRDAEDTIGTVRKDLEKRINGFNFNQFRDYVEWIKEKSETYQQYLQYGWYFSLVVSGICSFIALCFLFGLFYGCCGSRATYYTDDCCVRPTGAKFFCCGISVFLIFGFVFSVLIAAMMMAGANVSNLVCDPWSRPTDRPDMVSFVDRFFFNRVLRGMSDTDDVDIQMAVANLTLSKLLSQCSDGQTFYSAFGLDKKFQLERSGFGDDLENFVRSLRLPTDFELNIPEDVRTKARQIAVEITESDFDSIRFERFNETDQMNRESKRFDLETFEQKLRQQFGPKVPNSAPISHLFEQLKEIHPKTRELQKKMAELTDALSEVNILVDSLNRPIHADRINLAFNNLLDNEKLRNDAFLNATESYADSLESIIQSFEKNVQKSMRSEVTSCAPVRKILLNTHSAVCSHAVDPFNGVWMAMAVNLILCILLVLVGTSLSRLYNNIYPYTRYTVHEPTNDVAFATDDYTSSRLKYSSSSPYASHNYGYQDLYPPPYGNQRYR